MHKYFYFKNVLYFFFFENKINISTLASLGGGEKIQNKNIKSESVFSLNIYKISNEKKQIIIFLFVLLTIIFPFQIIENLTEIFL